MYRDQQKGPKVTSLDPFIVNQMGGLVSVGLTG